MAKTYKVSYKAYLNDRLKEVHFHGKITYPLYIQVTFDRKTIFFKSYYFELFSKPRYAIFMDGKPNGPSIADIIKMENELIEYVIDKTLKDFSLDLFKREYSFYSTDLCDITEEGFIEYLYIFLQDKGMPALAGTIRDGCKFRIPYEVVRDMKIALDKPLHKELVENSFYYAPPYLPLYGFMQQSKKWPLLSFSVMEWEDIKNKVRFAAYVIKYHPDVDAGDIMTQVDKWLTYLRKQEK